MDNRPTAPTKAAGLNLNGVAALLRGETIKFRPRGGSMSPRIPDGALVTVEPLALGGDLEVDDAVFCRVHGGLMLHLVKAVEGDRILIGNNKGKLNGWTARSQVYGRVVAVVP